MTSETSESVDVLRKICHNLNRWIKRGDETNLPSRIFPNNLCRYSACNKGGGCNSSVGVGYTHSKFFPKSKVWEVRENFVSGESWQKYLSQVIKINIHRDKSGNNTYLWYDVIKIVLYLYGLPVPKPITSIYSWEKQQTNSSGGKSYTTHDQSSSKLLNSSKIMKVWETITVKRWLRRHDNWT